MKVLIGATIVLASASCATAQGRPESEDALIARARGIHERVITLDTHVDIQPTTFSANQPNYVNGGLVNPGQQVDLPRMEQGGLDAVFFSIYQGQQQDFTPEGYKRAFDQAMAKVEAIRRMTTELAPNRIALATTAAEVRRIAANARSR
jgi:microsomal dipeptidase-like Zn-dependent dipeptidase